MGQIAIEGMKFYAYHGFYDEEQKIGADYVVDIYVHTNFSKAAQEDSLFDTINYETIYLVAKIEMNKSTRLLETIAERIMSSLKNKFNTIQKIKIRISKLHPPVGGEVSRAYVELEQNHVKTCAKTKKPMLCYNDTNCWCNELRVYPDTLRMLKQKYKGCLSREVLEAYSGK